MAVALEQTDDAFLVGRRQPGEDVGGFHRFRQLGIAHAFNVVAHQQALLLQADFAADFRRHQFVVAGQHFHRHAMGGQGLDGRCGAFFRRIEKRHVTDQRQCLFIGQAVGVAAFDHWPCRYRNHP
ncbi:hypothetical protein D3C86_1708390 [compost metagenome]